MVDFAVGEPIRLLPCMHFYHMRCIDEWLMRSYCCPSCMERVDVGITNTPTSPAHSGLRRRRRRRERGSTSSLASLVSLGAGTPPVRRVVERGAKRLVFLPVSRHVPGQVMSPLLPSGQAAHPSGQTVPSRQAACPIGQRVASPPGQGGGGNMNYLTDYSLSGHSSGQASSGQVEGASGGYDHDIQLLNHPELRGLSQDDMAYSMDQITFCDFQSASRGQPSVDQCSAGAVTPSDVGVASPPRFSPPVFEYHFEYPTSHLPTDPQQ